LGEDLEADSLEMLEIAAGVEEEFAVEIPEGSLPVRNRAADIVAWLNTQGIIDAKKASVDAQQLILSGNLVDALEDIVAPQGQGFQRDRELRVRRKYCLTTCEPQVSRRDDRAQNRMSKMFSTMRSIGARYSAC